MLNKNLSELFRTKSYTNIETSLNSSNMRRKGKIDLRPPPYLCARHNATSYEKNTTHLAYYLHIRTFHLCLFPWDSRQRMCFTRALSRSIPLQLHFVCAELKRLDSKRAEVSIGTYQEPGPEFDVHMRHSGATIVSWQDKSSARSWSLRSLCSRTLQVSATRTDLNAHMYNLTKPFSHLICLLFLSS